MNDQASVAGFVASCNAMASQRQAVANWQLYEALKRDFQQQHPGASHEEHQRAMQAIARAAGV